MTDALELEGVRNIAWKDALPDGAEALQVHFGRDTSGVGEVQIAVATVKNRPTKAQLLAMWNTRGTKTAMPVVVAAVGAEGVWLFCQNTSAAPLGPLPHARATQQLQAILDEPDGIRATQRIRAIEQAYDTIGTAGFSNHFLFAAYHLQRDVPRRADWAANAERAAEIAPKRGRELINALGFTSDDAPGGALVLRSSTGSRRAIAVLLDESEHFDQKSPRYQLSPVAHGLELAKREDVQWVIVMRQTTLRLYPGRDGVGVGQRGQSETYFELDLAFLDDDFAALLPLVFSAEALEKGGSTDQILDGSGRYAADLGTRLRDRVYLDVVPLLAVAVAQRLPTLGRAIDQEGLTLAYRLAMRILFRLLFQAYGEATELLPAGRNKEYDSNSLQHFVQSALTAADDDFSDTASSIWLDLVQVWDAISQGNPRWEVPAYGGALFDPETDEGQLLQKITLPDRVLGPALRAMLIEVTGEGVPGPVDFRSLQVREFGTIYEGLLESSLSLAENDLAVDKRGVYIPAEGDAEVVIPSGQVYFHSTSGERKATGSYYTPKIVVDHLIERSVEPALDAHLERVRELMQSGREHDAAALFFDFRVADLAMGSAHFLVAAVDKIERGMRDFLTATPVPGVRAELQRLAETARSALGADTQAAEAITEAQLLRRQVARRCIYGLDINPLAVELSRLALWIHTFVPGLPMSSLDHGLVKADALTGIGTVEEAMDALDATELFEPIIREPLAAAHELLKDYANASEADKSEVARGAEVLAQATKTAAPARAIFDVALAKRLGLAFGEAWDANQFIELAADPRVRDAVDALAPAHLPYLFPEVFLRENPGFDALVGNPPWEEVKVEERSFWLRYRPGLFGLSDAERVSEIARLRSERSELLPFFEEQKEGVERYARALRRGPFPGLSTGDPELAKAFAWRNWAMTRVGGRIGLVGPRTLLNTAGGELWRKEVLAKSTTDVVVLVNRARWAFDMEPRYAVALMAIHKSGGPGIIQFAGPFHSRPEFQGGSGRSQLSFEAIAKATEEATVPNISDRQTGEVFEQIRVAPRLDEYRSDWDYRPVREFDVTNDREFYDAGGWAEGRIPVWGGEGFNIWEPETGEVKAWADRAIAVKEIQRKRRRQIRDSRSAFLGQPPAWAEDETTLPYQRPRIAFRGISQRTNERTVIAAMIPGQVFLQNSAPYFFRRAGSARSDAWLLAFLSSIPLDWYARTLIETNLNFFIINGFPIPPLHDGALMDERIIAIAGRLAAFDERFRDWADELGVEVGTANSEATKSDLIAELDALVALLYGLTREQLEHVFASFQRGWDYSTRLAAVFEHYDRWKGAQ